ncbi:TPA: 50S ribosomal protein L9 [Patescibacteria group bacterium]|nr:50S ribosomal protein L9 [Patescibacteria group bacterium]
MRVILLEDIKGIGGKGEIKEVKDGFAKNLLIPKKQAEPATREAVLRWQIVWANKAKEEQNNLGQIEQAKTKLAGIVFDAGLATTKDGGVVESVNKQAIKSFLEKRGIKVEKEQIHLEHSLKDIGEHQVKLSLGHGVEGVLKINVFLK